MTIYYFRFHRGCDKFLGQNIGGFRTLKSWIWQVLWVKYDVPCVECLSNFHFLFSKKCDVSINHDILVIEDDPLSNFYCAGSKFLKFSQNIRNFVTGLKSLKMHRGDQSLVTKLGWNETQCRLHYVASPLATLHWCFGHVTPLGGAIAVLLKDQEFY